MQSIFISDKLTISVFAVSFLRERFVPQFAVVAGDGQVSQFMHMLLAILLRLGFIATRNHRYPALRDVWPLWKDVLHRPDIVTTAIAFPQISKFFFCLVRLLDLTEYKPDRKSTRLNSSHEWISYAVFCLKK